jgi:hypothetical protein
MVRKQSYLPKYKLLAEVVPGRPAAGADKPEVGPTYRVAYAPDGIQMPEGVSTCYDIFK